MTAYLSSLAPQKITKALNARGIRTVALPAFSALSSPVDSHADMLLLDADGSLFVYEGYSFEGIEELRSKFSSVTAISAPKSSDYPHDVALNVAIVGSRVLANTKSASPVALDYLESIGKTVLHVNQGYAHCSVCTVSDNAIITADQGIARAADKSGISVLLIDSGHVALPPYDHGFIGGASGSDEKNVYFCGSLAHHPNGEDIKSFCLLHGKTPVELSDSPLFDIGGILIK